MSRTRVKICGITTARDAAAAVAAGADAIGVIFAPSNRRVSVEQARAILREVPPMVARVGVFVDAGPDEIAAAVVACGLHAVELCGDESPEECASAPVPVIKTLHVGDGFTWAAFEPYRGHVSAVLLDTAVAGASFRGGTGVRLDWERALPLPADVPVVLAGGLDPDNVAEAVRAVRPFAVDVASGVEVSPGVKDHAKIAAFVSAVAGADAEGVR